jgi:hypothetical protein
MTTETVLQPADNRRATPTWLVGSVVAGLVAGIGLAGAYAAPAWLTPGFAEGDQARGVLLALGVAQGLGVGPLAHAVVHYRHRALPRGSGVRLVLRAWSGLLLGALVATGVSAAHGALNDLIADRGFAPYLLPPALFGAHVGWYLGTGWHLLREMWRRDAADEVGA